MITLNTILLIVISLSIIHWMGDFVFQNDKMAQGKSKNNKDLTNHILVYTGITILMWPILALLTGGIFTLTSFGLAALLIFVTHWVTDYITSRVNSKLHSAGRIHEFFVSVGWDQICHLIQYLLIYFYIFLTN